MAQPLSRDAVIDLQSQLQGAVVACTERCLYHSAKWAAELLNSFPEFEQDEQDNDNDSSMSGDTNIRSPQIDRAASASNLSRREAQLEARERHEYLLAQSYFNCREFDRCAAVFLPNVIPNGSTPSTPSKTKLKQSPKGKSRLHTSKGAKKQNTLSQRSLFLALYAKYMSGEKLKNEESEMILGPHDGGVAVNKELVGISHTLEDWFSQHADSADSQGWLEYLYGMVLAKGKNEEDAKRWLIKSIHSYAYNWGAWQELANLIASAEELTRIAKELPENLITYIFHIYTCQELYIANDQIHKELDQIQTYFPRNYFLQTQRALLWYHVKDFGRAETIFSDLLTSDPHRIDSLDHYSNILFVMNASSKLAFLAQLASRTDKFRPETCCVVGNYYSLKSEHEKAVMYFRRALTLDRTFLSAWTLMGHEYLEMKNTHAAIEAYRRAVDANRRDYRAWYGLGQTYELLEMYAYALWYYQRAAALRSHDPKMWQAVGACFARVDRLPNAVKAYKRALAVACYFDGSGVSPGGVFGSELLGQQTPSRAGAMDPEILYEIALLYERMRDLGEAAAYMELTLAQEEGPPDAAAAAASATAGAEGEGEDAGAGQGVGVTATTSKARMWLVRWESSRGGFVRAMRLANELCQDGVEVEDAKALIRDIRARIEKNREDAGESSDVDRKFGREMVA
ncbi:MAG: Anaphase-promoting complex subunit 23 [Bathelium mastoideum]|nr:MAG: Anaphase-promoting complex subunit 23 [Bathelium mastoideum]